MKKRILSLFSIVGLCVRDGGFCRTCRNLGFENLKDRRWILPDDGRQLNGLLASAYGTGRVPDDRGVYHIKSGIDKSLCLCIYDGQPDCRLHGHVSVCGDGITGRCTDDWGFVYAWAEEAENADYMSTADSVKVDRGYYYRVRSQHIAGDYDDYPYDETASVTDGILLP